MNELIYGASAADYHSDRLCDVPSLSASIATLLVTRSPAHAWEAHPRLGRTKAPTISEDGEVSGEDEDDSAEPDPHAKKSATTRGTIIHALVLGRGAEAIEVVPAEALATNGAMTTKAARLIKAAAEASGRVAVAEPKMMRYTRAADAIRSELERLKIDIDPKASEVVMLWEETADDGTIVQCRGLVDNLALAIGTIYDLKTGDTAQPDKLASKVLNFGAEIQAAAYTSGLGKIRPALAGRVQFRWLFCETSKSPYAVTIGMPGGAMRELGALKWRRAVNLWAQCRKRGEWPAYSDQIVTVEPPPWALDQEVTQ